MLGWVVQIMADKTLMGDDITFAEEMTINGLSWRRGEGYSFTWHV
jgi:hypothetical protein